MRCSIWGAAQLAVPQRAQEGAEELSAPVRALVAAALLGLAGAARVAPASAFSRQKRRLCDRCLYCGWRYCATFSETCFAMSPGMVYYPQTGPHGEREVGRASQALRECYTDPEGVFIRV